MLYVSMCLLVVLRHTAVLLLLVLLLLVLVLVLVLVLLLLLLVLTQNRSACCYCCSQALHCICQGLRSQAENVLSSNLAQAVQHLLLLLPLLLLDVITVQPGTLLHNSVACRPRELLLLLLLLLLQPLPQLWQQLAPQQPDVGLLQLSCMLQQQALCGTPATHQACLPQQLHITLCMLYRFQPLLLLKLALLPMLLLLLLLLGLQVCRLTVSYLADGPATCQLALQHVWSCWSIRLLVCSS
jgi:hypothetical protein